MNLFMYPYIISTLPTLRTTVGDDILHGDTTLWF